MNHLDFLEGIFEKRQHALVATVQTREQEREKIRSKKNWNQQINKRAGSGPDLKFQYLDHSFRFGKSMSNADGYNRKNRLGHFN